MVDRFGQTQPTVLVAADGYRYGGKEFSCLDRIAAITAQLPSLQRTVVLTCLRLPADHPVYILYSSGTTGKPKCITHRALGVLLMHLKEHQLHCDIRAGDRVLYFTTCGWMMWNWLVSVLASGATALLFDGSPAHPSPAVLFDIAARERLTLLGLVLDASANEAGAGERSITSRESRIPALVIPTNEELEIALQSVRVVSGEMGD